MTGVLWPYTDCLTAGLSSLICKLHDPSKSLLVCYRVRLVAHYSLKQLLVLYYCCNWLFCNFQETGMNSRMRLFVPVFFRVSGIWVSGMNSRLPFLVFSPFDIFIVVFCILCSFLLLQERRKERRMMHSLMPDVVLKLWFWTFHSVCFPVSWSEWPAFMKTYRMQVKRDVTLFHEIEQYCKLFRQDAGKIFRHYSQDTINSKKAGSAVTSLFLQNRGLAYNVHNIPKTSSLKILQWGMIVFCT